MGRATCEATATLNRDSLGLPEGLRSPAPTLTLYLCKELFVVLLGGQAGRGYADLSFSVFLVGEGGLAISFSGLLNIYMLCCGFLAYMEGTTDPCAPEIPF